jgi:hypothetical protein
MLKQIELDTTHAPAERFDLLSNFIERRAGAAGDSDVCPGAGQRAGKLLAQPPAGPGDKRDFASKIEGIRHNILEADFTIDLLWATARQEFFAIQNRLARDAGSDRDE